jgi:protein SCO1/2
MPQHFTVLRLLARAALPFSVVLLATTGAHAAPQPTGPNAQSPSMSTPLVKMPAAYRPSQIRLTRADGSQVRLDDELGFDGAIVLNFVFTSCSAVCPITSRTFSEVQAKLLPGEPVRLMSISLDPLNDTPEALRAYGKQFSAGRSWRFYTGTPDASADVQRAFDVYLGDKMNHAPFTLIRPGPGLPWTRVNGFATANDLLSELHRGMGRR